MYQLENVNSFKENRFAVILIFGAIFSLIFDNIPKVL